jgi:hypothetical protein
VFPGGRIESLHEDTPTSTVLDPGTLEQIDAIIDGPELRRGLRDGLSCEFVADSDTIVTLTLPDESLTQNVTGCIFAGVPGNVAFELYNLVKDY